MSATRDAPGRASDHRRRGWGAMIGVVAALTLVMTSVPEVSRAAPPALPSRERPSPAVSALEPGRIDLFWRTSTGRLAHRYRPVGGSWTRQLMRWGRLASQPAAVSWAPGRLDVFARGTDDTLMHRWYRNGTWSRWKSRGGRLTAAPAVASWKPGRLDVFSRARNGALLHRTYRSGKGWSKWRRRGGTLTSSPAATSWGSGRIDVVARGPGNRLLHRTYRSDRGWSAWRTRGWGLTSQPAIASPGEGMLDVAARRSGTTMWLRRYVRGEGWSSWTSLGSAFRSGPSATATGDDVRLAGQRPNGGYTHALRQSPTRSWSRWWGIDPLLPFRRLGTWVDVFDYAALDPEDAVADMDARGVRTLYLSTARFTDTGDFHDRAEAGAWLDAAHAAGIRVVGWYLPAYGDMSRDIRRTVAIARFTSPGGQRFDAVGVDIERLDEVSRTQFNTRLVEHLTKVRTRTDPMIAAIVPPPFATTPGTNWDGLPWAAIGSRSEVIVPMTLWSFRDNCPGPDVCPFSAAQVYRWVLDQVQQTRQLTDRPVSVEGGVDDPGTENTPVTRKRVARFVDAVIDGGAIGGSHYDYRTTAPRLWSVLERLNDL